MDPSTPQISQELRQELGAAGRILQTYGQSLLTPEFLLLAFIRRPGSAAHQALKELPHDQAFDLKELESTVETMARARRGSGGRFSITDTEGNRVPFSTQMVQLLDQAAHLAEDYGQPSIDSDQMLAAMSLPRISTAGLLRRYGITAEAIRDRFAPLRPPQAPEPAGEGPQLPSARPAASPRFYPRTGLLQELTGLLSLSRNRHVILIGPAQVGKRSLVYSLKEKMVAGEGPSRLGHLVEISEKALLVRPKETLESSLARARGGILFIPHIHRFFGGRLDAQFDEETNTLLHHALLSDEVTVIGTTDQGAYDRLMSKNLLVTEHSHLLKVPPTTLEETTAILRLHRAATERDYSITIDDALLEGVAALAERYLSTTPLPGAAIDLVHRAAASLRAMSSKQEKVLDSEDLMLTLSQMTGIPVNKLGADERTRYARMVEHLHERIIGQHEAVLAVSRAVKTARVGLKDPKRPIGSFLFLGPSGVGKTELAKALAEFLFGDENAAIELDMSEYQQEHSVNRFIGAPPGYKGHEEGGQLTEAVRQKPYSVVLFDEVEKAHPRVTDILLQVMEEGRLTDGQGRTTRFNETVVILTSNLGSEYLVDPVISPVQRELVMETVKEHFRPEFLNRLDDIILFHPLTQEQLRLILGLMLRKEIRLAAESGIALEVTEAAREWLLGKNDQPQWGARPLRRILRRYLREPLADFLLQADYKPGSAIRVDAEGDRLSMEVIPAS